MTMDQFAIRLQSPKNPGRVLWLAWSTSSYAACTKPDLWFDRAKAEARLATFLQRKQDNMKELWRGEIVPVAFGKASWD